MSRCYTQLARADRRRLHQLVAANVPVNGMARQLGRHRSTIYREIKRNTFRDRELPDYDGYDRTVADDIAKERHWRLRKLRRHPHLRRMIIEKLEAYWSPEQIAGRLLADGISLVRICKKRFTVSSMARRLTGLAFTATCPRHAANAVRVDRRSRVTAYFQPVTGYRNALILSVIDPSSAIGKAIC